MLLQVQRLIRHKEAEATAQGVTWSELAAEVAPDFEDPQGLLGTPYACHTAIINYMGPTQLFERLCEVGFFPCSLVCSLTGEQHAPYLLTMCKQLSIQDCI